MDKNTLLRSFIEQASRMTGIDFRQYDPQECIPLWTGDKMNTLDSIFHGSADPRIYVGYLAYYLETRSSVWVPISKGCCVSVPFEYLLSIADDYIEEGDSEQVQLNIIKLLCLIGTKPADSLTKPLKDQAVIAACSSEPAIAISLCLRAYYAYSESRYILVACRLLRKFSGLELYWTELKEKPNTVTTQLVLDRLFLGGNGKYPADLIKRVEDEYADAGAVGVLNFISTLHEYGIGTSYNLVQTWDVAKRMSCDPESLFYDFVDSMETTLNPAWDPTCTDLTYWQLKLATAWDIETIFKVANCWCIAGYKCSWNHEYLTDQNPFDHVTYNDIKDTLTKVFNAKPYSK